jgi:hypothetical protein
MSLELSFFPNISKVEVIHLGGQFLSRIQDEMEFGEARVGSNKLGQRRLSRECSTFKHGMLSFCVVLGLVFIFKNMDIGPTLGAKSSALVASFLHSWYNFLVFILLLYTILYNPFLGQVLLPCSLPC